MNIDHILVPFNGSYSAQYALETALEVARKFKADLLVLYVAPLKPLGVITARPTQSVLSEGSFLTPTSPSPRTTAVGVKRGQEIIELAKTLCKEKGVLAKFEIRQGSREEEILKAAKQGIDLIVLGVLPKKGMEALIFGSIAKALLNCPCSLFIVHAPPQDIAPSSSLQNPKIQGNNKLVE